MPFSGVPIGQFAAQRSNLRFVCRECGSSVVAPIDEVVCRFGLGVPVGNLQALAVCRACNSIDVIIVPDAVAVRSF